MSTELGPTSTGWSPGSSARYRSGSGAVVEVVEVLGVLSTSAVSVSSPHATSVPARRSIRAHCRHNMSSSVRTGDRPVIPLGIGSFLPLREEGSHGGFWRGQVTRVVGLPQRAPEDLAIAQLLLGNEDAHDLRADGIFVRHVDLVEPVALIV